MNVEGNIVAAALSFLTAVGAGIGWWLNRRDKRKDPLPKSAAEVAVAKEALGVVVAAAEWDRTRGARVQADLTGALSRIDMLEKSRTSDETRITGMHARITRLETLLSHAAAFIEALLRWAQLIPTDPTRPIPPLPIELHELVDPALWITKPSPEGNPE